MFEPVYRIKSKSLLKEGQSAFFAADPHFCHDVMASKRGFKDVNGMNDRLVGDWNGRVGEEDVVFLMGDVGMKFGPDELDDIISELNGRIYLILGNHDNDLVKHERLLARFELVQHYLEFTYKRGKGDHYHFCFHHYPHRAWNRSHFGSFDVHGHCHGKLDPMKNSLDVGYDSLPVGKWPVSCEEAVMLLTEPGYSSVYLLFARRFSEQHAYPVGSAYNYDDAVRAAEDHCKYRGGKYSVEVYASEPYGHKDNPDNEDFPELVYTAETPYKKEREP